MVAGLNWLSWRKTTMSAGLDSAGAESSFRLSRRNAVVSVASTAHRGSRDAVAKKARAGRSSRPSPTN
jgi:hypothetical protein